MPTKIEPPETTSLAKNVPVEGGALNRIASALMRDRPSFPELSPREHIGFYLSRLIVFGLGLVLAFFLITFYLRYPTKRDIPLFALIEKGTIGQNQADFVALSEQANKQLLERQKEFTHDWLEVMRTVVLMAMMPVLTSLLGYTFGSQKAAKD